METEKALNDKILELTKTIRDQYPELLKYLDEMPITIPNENHPQVNNTALNDYYLALKSLLDNYAEGKSVRTNRNGKFL